MPINLITSCSLDIIVLLTERSMHSISTRLGDQGAAELVEPEEDALNAAEAAARGAVELASVDPGVRVEEEPAELADGDLDE